MVKETFVTQLQKFLDSKGITHDDAKKYLTEVFKKAFEKDRDALSNYEKDEPELAKIDVSVDMTKGEVSIKKIMTVVEEKSIASRFTEIEITDERIKDKNLKIGDEYIEEIDLNNINISKRQHIKQLFKQKLSELDKKKVYEKFSKYKGELLNAKVHRVLDKGSVILDYEGDSIFMPANEISPLDRKKIKEGKFLTVYILEIEEISKDAQIIASRKNPNFVSKLIEREIEDVSDGVVKIESISREVGFKTKVAVSTNILDVDPVGSIIGVRGQRIKPIIDELSGERLDIIKYHSDIKKFISEALLPAELIGINIGEKNDDSNLLEVTVIVEDDQFLPALGKRGLNIKLAAILTKTKIDVKTIKDAEKENISWEKVNLNKYTPKYQESNSINIDDGGFDYIEEMAESQNSDLFSEEDYVVNDEFIHRNNNLSENSDFEDEDDKNNL